MKILVVDDSATMRRIICNTLKQAGQEDVVQAEHGADALAQLKKHPDIGLILTDWNMPMMDGYEFLTHVRADNKEIPVIMVTTEAEKSNVVKAIKAGANSYVVKPFTPDVIAEKIKPFLK